jgi:preprotein translocase subunit SecE
MSNSKGSKVSTYIRESYDELLHKVSWPTWSELQQSTAIVLVATILLTAVVWLMDLASSSVLKFIYSIFK